jgi:CBS domain-containing protein
MPPPEPSLSLPVKYLIKRAPAFIEPTATVSQAAAMMQNAGISSLLVADDPPGILTDRDLRGRVLAAGLSPETLVRDVMSRPLKTLDSDQSVFAALRLMLEDKIHHLALVEEGKIVGLITGSDLLQQQASNPLYLRGILDAMEDPAMIAHYSREVAGAVQTLFRGGLGAVQIGEIVSNLNDALVKRLVRVTQQSLGAPPTPFAWIVFGSEGRSEQTLLTDQDNALVYRDQSAEAHTYFTAFAKRVVDGLIHVGFPPCPGGFMATNWCKPVDEWRQLFISWVRTPEPRALLDAGIFFDFRPVAGALSLEPLEEILTAAANERRFIAQAAEEALRWGPPLGFFNRIHSDHGMVDLKKAGIGPIVNLARVCALAAGSRERSTLERLAAAGKSGVILTEKDANELTDAFQFLSYLRLRHQLTRLEKNQPLDHTVDLRDLSVLERHRLRDVFVMIRRIQDAVRLSVTAS